MRTLLILLLALPAWHAHAAVYKCTTADDQVIFTDKPCNGGKGAEIKRSELPPVNAATESAGREPAYTTNAAGNQVRYVLQNPDGTRRAVSEEEFLEQKEKNRVAERDQALKKRYSQPSESRARKRRAEQCYADRQMLKTASRREQAAIRQRLDQNCGGA